MFSLNFLFPFKILAIGLQKVFCSQLDCFRMLISPSKREMQTRNSGRRNFINESSSQAIRMGPPGKWCTEGLNRAPQSNVESTGPGRPSAYLSSLPDFKNHLSFWRDASSNIKYHRLKKKKKPNSTEICLLIAKQEYRRSKPIWAQNKRGPCRADSVPCPVLWAYKLFNPHTPWKVGLLMVAL